MNNTEDKKEVVAQEKAATPVLKSFPWTMIDGERVGLGGPSYIMKGDKRIDIKQATPEQMKKYKDLGKK